MSNFLISFRSVISSTTSDVPAASNSPSCMGTDSFSAIGAAMMRMSKSNKLDGKDACFEEKRSNCKTRGLDGLYILKSIGIMAKA